MVLDYAAGGEVDAFKWKDWSDKNLLCRSVVPKSCPPPPPPKREEPQVQAGWGP